MCGNTDLVGGGHSQNLGWGIWLGAGITTKKITVNIPKGKLPKGEGKPLPKSKKG
ncbi:hypothetical protein EBI_27604, partial [Enterocytozoon bieneusi H348]